MAEEKTPEINLTLDSEFSTEVPAAPDATAFAAAEQEVPSLVLGTEEEKAVKEEDAPVEKLDIDSLSPAEQAAVREFSKKIDVSDSTQVLNYGSNAQKNISEFSGEALSQVRTKDLGEVGNMLGSLVVELKGLNFDESQTKGLKALFKRSTKNLAALKAQYDKAEVNVDKIVAQLDEHWVTLNKDIVTMDKMYEMNSQYFKELSMYIIAGKLRLQELRETELPRLQQKAAESNLPEDAQAASDYANLLGRFEKKIYDLELTRQISIQMGPQIRLIQNNDSLMAEKIQTAIVNTIPLWKQQMVLALSMYHSEQAMNATHSVNEVTNDLLKKNAETLHMGSVAVAQESERGIVDLETLKQTNAELISTLEEVRQIQDNGRSRRQEAEVELGRIEGELKKKLLEMKG